MKLYTPAFAALFLANLSMVSSFAAFFLLPLYITEYGGDSRDIGMIMGIFAMASACSRPWVSEMIDRLGRKRSYTIGTTMMTVLPLTHLLLLGPVADHYSVLLLVRILHGIGLAICFTGVFTFIIDLIPVQRLNEGIGIFGTSGLIGLAIGPLVAEPVLKTYGYPAFFLTASGFAALSMLLHLPVEDRYREQLSSPEPAPSFFALLKTRKQMVSGGLALIFGIGLAASSNFIAPFAEERQLDHLSLYFLAYSVAAIGVRIIAGRLADRIGENQIIPWGLTFAALALLLVPLITSDLSLLSIGFVFGIGHGLLFPALNAMAIRGEPYAVRGKVTGIFTGGIDSGSFLGAMLLGLVGQWAGFTVLFLCAGAAMLGGFLVFRLRPARS